MSSGEESARMPRRVSHKKAEAVDLIGFDVGSDAVKLHLIERNRADGICERTVSLFPASLPWI
jgi:hypothetical protein